MAELQRACVPCAPLCASLPHPSLLHRLLEPNPNWKHALPCNVSVARGVIQPGILPFLSHFSGFGLRWSKVGLLD